MESLLFWMASIAINIWVTERLTQWMFKFWFCIMNYLSPEKETNKKVVSYLPPTPKQTSLMLQSCPFRILFMFHHCHCVDWHPPFSYRTHKNCLRTSFLKAIVRCRSLFHSLVTILSTMVLCIHSLYSPRSCCSTHSTIHTSLMFIITLLLRC